MNIKDKVKGPVIPIPVPFNKNETIDYESLKSYVAFLVKHGIKNIMTTVGTSRYNLLTFQEVKKVNETVVNAANGKANTIVANPPWGGTLHASEFARHSQKIGADYFLVYFPERDYGDENTLLFFEQIHNNSNIDILIHEMPRRNGFGSGSKQYGLGLLKELLAFERIVGIKEESLDERYSNMLVENLSDEAILIGAGGGMSRYLYRDYDRGAQAFLGGIGNIKPEVELSFYKDITSGKRESATQIVEDIEIPYFDDVVPIGWHPHLKAALYLKGLMPKWERSPMKRLSNQEYEIIENLLKKNNLL